MADAHFISEPHHFHRRSRLSLTHTHPIHLASTCSAPTGIIALTPLAALAGGVPEPRLSYKCTHVTCLSLPVSPVYSKHLGAVSVMGWWPELRLMLGPQPEPPRGAALGAGPLLSYMACLLTARRAFPPVGLKVMISGDDSFGSLSHLGYQSPFI